MQDVVRQLELLLTTTEIAKTAKKQFLEHAARVNQLLHGKLVLKQETYLAELVSLSALIGL